MIPVSLYMFNIMSEYNKSEENIEVSFVSSSISTFFLTISLSKEVKINNFA